MIINDKEAVVTATVPEADHNNAHHAINVSNRINSVIESQKITVRAVSVATHHVQTTVHIAHIVHIVNSVNFINRYKEATQNAAVNKGIILLIK